VKEFISTTTVGGGEDRKVDSVAILAIVTWALHTTTFWPLNAIYPRWSGQSPSHFVFEWRRACLKHKTLLGTSWLRITEGGTRNPPCKGQSSITVHTCRGFTYDRQL
jgi:hypothetical protein